MAVFDKTKSLGARSACHEEQASESSHQHLMLVGSGQHTARLPDCKSPNFATKSAGRGEAESCEAHAKVSKPVPSQKDSQSGAWDRNREERGAVAAVW